jgi:hypothetical protein
MVQSKGKTVEDYLAELSPERREVIAAVRDVIRRNLPARYEERMQYGMISWGIPLERFPNTYNGQPLAIASLASQKAYASLYLMNVCGDRATRDWFVREYRASGKRLDMGQSCVRFRRLKDLPLNLIAKAISRTPVADCIRLYEAIYGR